MSSHTQGVRIKAGAVKAWEAIGSNKDGQSSGVVGGDEVSQEWNGALLCTMRRGRGALVHIRQRRRWRARSAGVGGGFMVQFFALNQC